LRGQIEERLAVEESELIPMESDREPEVLVAKDIALASVAEG
jgi:hypothetical protein